MKISVEKSNGEISGKEREVEIAISINDSWKHQRARLHHDWLQNSYLTFLRAEAENLDHPEKCLTSHQNILEQLLIWEQKRLIFLKFIGNTVEALSPRQLLFVPPLDKMMNEDKEWLGPLIHALYLERSAIAEKVQLLTDAFCEIDKLVKELSLMLQSESAAKNGYGQKLLEKVLELSKQISALPYDIQII